MKSWRPALIVRRGRSGGISSPVTTGGYVVQGIIGLAFCTAGIIAGVRANPVFFFHTLLGVFAFRDVLAWFASTVEERAAFTREVARLGSEGVPHVALDARVGDGRLGPTIGFLLVGAALIVACGASNLPLFLAGMAALGLGVATLLGVLLRAFTTRRAAAATRSR